VETATDRVNTPTANQAAAMPLFHVFIAGLFRRLVAFDSRGIPVWAMRERASRPVVNISLL
jgi:hypothetical protein